MMYVTRKATRPLDEFGADFLQKQGCVIVIAHKTKMVAFEICCHTFPSRFSPKAWGGDSVEGVIV